MPQKNQHNIGNLFDERHAGVVVADQRFRQHIRHYTRSPCAALHENSMITEAFYVRS